MLMNVFKSRLYKPNVIPNVSMLYENNVLSMLSQHTKQKSHVNQCASMLSQHT
ncbi:hypothetical protein HanRHA438_Chr11g0497041 [Helianthus annuus]|nr:hypothetical protein HanRHA438_Chr11g0497041 [Helianthus annuus]